MEVTSPVSTLDLGFTMAKLADINTSELDGMDLIPLLEGDEAAKVAFDSRDLYWRFYYQRAVRKGKYKYLQAGINREYLFDLESDPNEKINIISDNQAIAEELKALYWQWDAKMYRQDTPIELNRPFGNRYDFYLGN